MPKKVLIVEDENNIAELLHLYLEKEGFTVKVAQRGDDALTEFRRLPPDWMLLDLMLPGVDGWQVLKTIRKTSTIPVIMLTAKDETFDKVLGLELGADDYLPKPFHMAELVARVKSVLRRKHRDGENSISVGNIEVLPDSFQVKVGGEFLELSRKEYDTLHYFINRPNRLVNKATLAESVWGDYIDQVDNYDFIYAQIKNLRKKLKDAGATAEVKAVYGFGYKFVEI